MRYNKDCVGTPIIHKSDYTKFTINLFLLILTALIDIFYTFASAYISCKEMYLYQALKKFGIK